MRFGSLARAATLTSKDTLTQEEARILRRAEEEYKAHGALHAELAQRVLESENLTRQVCWVLGVTLLIITGWAFVRYFSAN